MTDKEILDSYVVIAEFMSLCFSPDVEVLVHDVADLNHSVIALFNDHISGREPGAPMTTFGRELIAAKAYQSSNWVVNYKGVTDKGVVVRSSTLFIKNTKGDLIGALCVNVDMRKYESLKHLIDSMTHMNLAPGERGEPEILATSAGGQLEKTVSDFCGRSGRRVEALTADERIEILREIHKHQFFERKGAISEVAERLKISEPSVYRYLKTIKRGLP